jgi:RimJ/RimL family protein N-acetyltransferase
MIARATAQDRTEDTWVIDGSAYGHAEALGLITLERMDRGQSEVFYWIAPAFWNAGFATEAVRALIAANPHGSDRIFAEVFQDNPGSARVLTNCGFDYLGDAEAFSVSRKATVPTWTYTLKQGS